MATQAKSLNENWEKITNGKCIIQVQEGEILIYIGTNEPSNSDSVNSYIIGDFFIYTGQEDVYAKARGKAKIVYDTGF